VLIAGGSDKSLEFEQLARVIASQVRVLILLDGTATGKIMQAVERAGGKEKIAGTFDGLERAVERAAEIAREGEVVLLSPGCASFGMFANEFERGDKFKECISAMVQ
jgi:UDP-N-acetylmuramoylalanine--D-glutamate ligase